MKKEPRDYQKAFLNSIVSYVRERLSQGKKVRTIATLPVGSGKSLCAAMLAKKAQEDSPRCKILIVTHQKELLVQNYEELKSYYPEADAGFYCAGLGKKHLHNDIVFCSIQSISGNVSNMTRAPELIICDECHLISHSEDTLYRKFFADCEQLNPNVIIIGLTGSPFRSSTGRLDEGENALFDDIAYQIDMGWMIREGYWTRPVSPNTETKISADGVKIVNGDYAAKQLEEAVDVDEVTKAWVAELVQLGSNRRKWLVFTAGLKHCEHVRDIIRSHGISCEMVTGKMSNDERNSIFSRYKAGEFVALVNVAVATTGINVPDIDLIAFGRPSRSPVLVIQMSGRGVRPVYANGFDLSTREGRLDSIAASKKPDCMFLDFGRIFENLGPLDAIDIRKKERRESPEEHKPILKICPSCGTECAPAQRYCYSCSYQFPFAELDTKAARNLTIMSADIEPETYTVWNVGYHIHTKKDNPDAPPTMRVNYTTNGGQFSEWVCFQHQGFAQTKAAKWHMERLPLFPVPKTVAEAVELPYPRPEEIKVRKEGKYNRIIDYIFRDSMEPITPEGYQFKNAEEVNLDDIAF